MLELVRIFHTLGKTRVGPITRSGLIVPCYPNGDGNNWNKLTFLFKIDTGIIWGVFLEISSRMCFIGFRCDFKA